MPVPQHIIVPMQRLMPFRAFRVRAVAHGHPRASQSWTFLVRAAAVVFARLILGERTSLMVNLSLLPGKRVLKCPICVRDVPVLECSRTQMRVCP